MAASQICENVIVCLIIHPYSITMSPFQKPNILPSKVITALLLSSNKTTSSSTSEPVLVPWFCVVGRLPRLVTVAPAATSLYATSCVASQETGASTETPRAATATSPVPPICHPLHSIQQALEAQ